jgi:hypothetical protein
MSRSLSEALKYFWLRSSGVRETVQNLKKRGEPLASDMSKNLGLLTAHLFTVLRLPSALLGLFGLRLETQV